jgi:hypothetical protein
LRKTMTMRKPSLRGDAMSQTVAFNLPLPVAIALAVFLVLLCALSAVMLSLRKPAPVRAPLRQEGEEWRAGPRR